MLTALELSDASSNNIDTETWHQEEGDQDIKEAAIKKDSKISSLTLQRSLSEGKEILGPWNDQHSKSTKFLMSFSRSKNDDEDNDMDKEEEVHMWALEHLAQLQQESREIILHIQHQCTDSLLWNPEELTAMAPASLSDLGALFWLWSHFN